MAVTGHCLVEHVIIRGFRALSEVNVRLRPLTVLVGPNDSGKSSFLAAIGSRLSLKSGPSRDDSWRGVGMPEVKLFASDGNQLLYASAEEEIYKLPSEGVPMESEGVSESDAPRAPRLESSGKNLAALLDHLLRRDRKRFDQIQSALRKLVPGVEEILIHTPQAAERAVSVKIEDGFEIPGRRLSAGVRMLFFFVALAHHPSPPDLALVEEPENGVHPRRLKDIVGLLRNLTTGELTGRPVQVILSTHSPYLLDHIRLPEDQVLVFQREADGRRSAREIDAERLRHFLDEFMLGEVWFNEGETGLLAARQ